MIGLKFREKFLCNWMNMVKCFIVWVVHSGGSDDDRSVMMDEDVRFVVDRAKAETALESDCRRLENFQAEITLVIVIK